MRACSSRYLVRLLRPAQHVRRARHGQRAQGPGGRGRELRRSEPRRAGRLAVTIVIPVAQAAGRQAILRFRLDVVGEAAHHVEIVAEHLRVAAPLVLLPGQQHRRRAPFDRPVERAGKPAGRIAGGDRQHAPARLLRVADIPQDLVEPAAAVVAILERRREEIGTFEPAEFFPVGTVGQHMAGVGAYRPVDQPVRAVEQFAGAFESTGLGQRRAHMDQFQRADNRKPLGIGPPLRDGAGHLDELHAQIERHPLVSERLAVTDQFAADDVAAEQAVLGVLVLAAAEADSIAGLAARQLDAQLRGTVLGKAVQIDARGRFLDGLRREAFLSLERRPVLGREGCRGGLGRAGRFPRRVVKKLGPVPARPLAASVEILAGEDVREHHGALGRPPGGVRADAADRAVILLQDHLGAQQQRLARLALRAVLVIAARRRIRIVPERVEQHHADAVDAGLDP